MRQLLLLSFASSVLLAGCASYETTYLARDAEGRPVVTTVAGTPIVVTAPQKIGFLATETTYAVNVVKANADGTSVKIGEKTLTETTVDKTPIQLGYSQVAHLDVKRPFYGTAKNIIDLEGQYPTKVSSDVDDKTLGRVLDSADKVFDKLVEKQSAPAGGESRKIVSQRSYMIVYDPETRNIQRVKL
ncbi:hypothetical protein GJW-30_1_04490 [Variibacter gotjawalensis]|uniref:Lipoprotein n=1 Tax=Variibacter gotjawalensis TaxID=1333996 RepID=A0A0S3Q181_9BRAD|nr:hypothetical protein [Variibacter gotjawalensis]NIK47775.1 hypothetical protein [Variibacter gotjawalensis]RZS49662.1 hypothetical protein EV661_2101 [Variibacter gotjawalensis]BAT61928.1 hypothetical protein GJW-30_1_04490 [Variibacter gotjawalensis]